MLRVIHIKYKNGAFSFTDRIGNNADPVFIRKNGGDEVRWMANKNDIDEKGFTGFEIDLKGSTPFGGETHFDSQQAGRAGVFKAESGPSDMNLPESTPYKYSVTLKPSGTNIDPEIRVEDDASAQAMLDMLITSGSEANTLVCPDETAYEGDLMRFELDWETLGEQDFVVEFPGPNPLYLPTREAKNLRGVARTNTTFYCQVQPVSVRSTRTYRVNIVSLHRSGEGKITVLPRPSSEATAV